MSDDEPRITTETRGHLFLMGLNRPKKMNAFDAEMLRPIIKELATRAVPLSTGREAEALKGLTAVDGSIMMVTHGKGMLAA